MRELQFMWDGGNVRRHHTRRVLMEDTVGHHSYNVACLIMHLRPNASAALLRAALKHDMAEHKVGDMPSPTKRALPDYGLGGTFREVFSRHEADIAQLHGVNLEHGLPPEDEWVLSLADCLDGMRFCAQERAHGNYSKENADVYKNYRAYISVMLIGEEGTALDMKFAELVAPAQDIDRQTFLYVMGLWSTASGR